MFMFQQGRRRSIKQPQISIVCLFCHVLLKKLKSCGCQQVQLFPPRHLRARSSECRTCEVSAARNVPEHVYAVVFVCRNRLSDQWVEVACDLSMLIRNL